MWFFKIVVCVVVGALYAQIFSGTVLRFFDRIGDSYRVSPSGWIQTLFVNILTLSLIPLLFCVAPLLWIIGKRWGLTEEKERAKQDLIAAKRIEENNRRDEACKQWIKENRTYLFYNTQRGITAVLTPQAYAQAQRDTRYAKLDGKWGHEKLLVLAVGTYMFVTQEGWLVTQEKTAHNPWETWIVGFRSSLERTIEQGDVQLIHAPDIFVPGVSEGIYTFRVQMQYVERFRNRSSRDLFAELLGSQAPEELRPL